MQLTAYSLQLTAVRRLPFAVCCLLFAVCSQGTRTGSKVIAPPAGMKTIAILIGKDTIQAEVANTELTREHGLMDRLGMPAKAGMLFVFDSAGIYPFWMRNTEFPLSIAFMDGELRITDIEDMTPYDETNFHSPSRPALYALEVNQGWFADHGIQPGVKVEFLDSLPR
jgi:uncharacterized membrane protein (UPF0127 family)